MDRITKGSEMAKLLSVFCNSFTVDVKGFVAQIMNEHRTLQQTVFGLMMATIKEWAKEADTGRYDLRNEATVKMSKKIMDALGDDTYIPFI